MYINEEFFFVTLEGCQPACLLTGQGLSVGNASIVLAACIFTDGWGVNTFVNRFGCYQR